MTEKARPADLLETVAAELQDVAEAFKISSDVFRILMEKEGL